MTGVETALLAAGLKETAGPAKSLIGKLGKEAYNQLAVKFGERFQGHVEAACARCAKVKNILYKDESVGLRDQYVNVNFQSGKKVRSDAQVVGSVVGGGKILIAGTAGAGKTMFMKWAALEIINSIDSHGRIPLYLELRYIEERDFDNDLLSYLHNRTSALKDKSSYEQFLIGMKAGLFLIILDAVDEVKPEIRDQLVENIRRMMADFPKASLLISSRPDERLQGIQDLVVLKTTSMSLQQILAVIGKLEYDEEVKTRLTERLKSGLYSDHKEFLSNPLLATIMLLTFDHSAEIPTKLTSFYKQAFSALYERHDAAKGAYRRGHCAGLPLGTYEKIFSIFCFDSYIDGKIEFSDSSLLDYFNAAAEYAGVEAKPQDLFTDAMDSICLIQKEGLDNVFVHRSFQEYFVALFISEYREDDVRGLIEGIASNSQGANVLSMLVELSPEVFEYEWLLPNLEAWLAKVGKARLSTKTGLAKMFSSLQESVFVLPKSGVIEWVSVDSGASASGGRAGRWMAIAERAYGREKSLQRHIFIGGPVFDDVQTYVEGLPPEIAPDYDQLMRDRERFPSGEKGEEDWFIRLTPKDAGWLIQSRLPHLFSAVRNAAQQLATDIADRRADRRQSVRDRLKSRVRRRENRSL
jgi:hypothetical protein